MQIAKILSTKESSRASRSIDDNRDTNFRLDPHGWADHYYDDLWVLQYLQQPASPIRTHGTTAGTNFSFFGGHDFWGKSYDNNDFHCLAHVLHSNYPNKQSDFCHPFDLSAKNFFQPLIVF